MAGLKDLKGQGHGTTLFMAFLYFDMSFMVWTMLGPLSTEIAEALALGGHIMTASEKATLLSLPILSGAILRIVLGFGVDKLGAKITALISSWDSKKAYLELQNLMRAGEEMHYIFNLLIRQFRLLLACFDLKDLSSSEIWKTLWIAPFAASSLKKQVWNFSLEQLLEKNEKCYQIDKWIKTWKIPSDEILALNIEKELIF